MILLGTKSLYAKLKRVQSRYIRTGEGGGGGESPNFGLEFVLQSELSTTFKHVLVLLIHISLVANTDLEFMFAREITEVLLEQTACHMFKC